jgi:hypothetical protein
VQEECAGGLKIRGLGGSGWDVAIAASVAFVQPQCTRDPKPLSWDHDKPPPLTPYDE